jgi:putative Mg2+ transporter-C (MgtC) family protein
VWREAGGFFRAVSPLPLMGDTLLDLPDTRQLVNVTVRLLAAVMLGGLLGYERERAGKPAGLRTHMLVCLGSALFVVGSIEAGMSIADSSRVIQGIVAGIGFLGAGAILKRADQDVVTGLTTAASIWFTAALGTAIGVGPLWVAVMGTALAWPVLFVLGRWEAKIAAGSEPPR